MKYIVSTGFLILLAIGAQRSFRLGGGTTFWPLLILALSALSLYSLIHVEYRFIGAFVSLLWLGAFSLVRLPAARDSNKLIVGVVIAVAATTFFETVWWISQKDPQDGTKYWKAAQALIEKGIGTGDKVAIVGYDPAGEGGTYLARLARIQIIAQVNEPDRFWTADSSTQSRVIEVIAKTGAKAILTWPEPPHSSPKIDWQRLGNTYYFMHLLTTADNNGLTK